MSYESDVVDRIEQLLIMLDPKVGDIWDTPGLVANSDLNPIDVISYSLLRALFENTGDSFFKCFLIQSIMAQRIEQTIEMMQDFADPDSDTVH